MTSKIFARAKATSLILIILSLCYSVTHSQTDDPSSRQLQQLAPVKALPVKAKRWALIVGIDQYVDSQISPLKGAANDARMLADSLIRYAGFPPDQVVVLATDQPSERQPTRVNILRRLSNIASAVPKDGLLLVSFAGHGIERAGQAYLLPSDAQITDEISFLEDTAVSVSRMKERIQSIGVQQVMILLDACRNDPGGRADAPNNLTPAYVNAFNFSIRNREVEAFVVLYATAVGQRAYEFSEKRQGYFTWAVVEGLKGAAANEQGEVTLAQLVKYVQEAVPKRIMIDLGAAKQQRPFATIDGYLADQLVLAVVDAKLATTASSSSVVDPIAVELSFWDSVKNSDNAEDFKAYLNEYPNGRFSQLAKNRLAALDAPKTEARNPVNSSPDRSTEVAFWNSVKDSTNIEDFKSYLKKYPEGEFGELANNRIRSLESALKREEQRQSSELLAAEIQRQTKTYRISWGFRASMNTQFWPAKLVISPGAFRILDDAGKDVKWNCPSFEKAKVDSIWIREIECGVGKCRIQTESPSQASEALQGIKAACTSRFGIRLSGLTAELASQHQIDNKTKGVVIVELDPSGAGATAGLKIGDVIEQVNQFLVNTPEELVAASRVSGAREMMFSVNRRGQKMSFTIIPRP